MAASEGLAALRSRSTRSAQIGDRIVAFVQALAEDDGGRERARQHPFETLRGLIEVGATSLRVPQEYGGTDLPLRDFFEVIEDLGYADASFPNVLRGHFSFIEILRHVPDERIRRHWFGEIVKGRFFGNGQSEPRVAGEEPPATPRTRLRREGDSWRIDGTKIYSSGALYGDYVRVSATGPDGQLLWAIVPAADPGVERLDDWNGFGQQLSASGTTHYRGARVDDIGVFPIRDGAGQHLSFTQLIHLATLTGVIRRVLDEAVGVLRERSATGRQALTGTPREDPVRLEVIGKLAAQGISAQALVARAADELDAANQSRTEENFTEVYARAFLATSAAQIVVIRDALDATSGFFDVGGASLTDRERALDRFWRNARTISSHNPVIDKAPVLGAYLVNGTLPRTIWGGR